ncbi:MAG: peptide ABC transporter substrate-binding protein [Parachlamydiales bacterium]|nr:peptide ABC transporter substrate-binding protein [Parachlamydiales bacterium]
MNILLRLFFIFFAVTLIFTSCKNNERKVSNKNVISFNINSDPNTLDPRKARDLNSMNISKIFFEGLTRLDKEGNPTLAIAKSYTLKEDKKTYVFKLKDSFWSNGDKLTAYDFEYAWKAVLDPNFSSSMAYKMFIIKNSREAKDGKISIDDVKIKAIDEKTLMVELERSTPYFLHLLANPIFFPINKKNDLENKNWHQDEKSFVCNGIFTLNQWKNNEMIECIKNKDYWDESQVKITKINMIMTNEKEEIKMYKKNKLDIVGSPFSFLPTKSLKKLKKRKDFHSQPYFGTSFLRINVEKINDKLFRKALSKAINRKALVEYVLQQGEYPAKRLIPDYFIKNKQENDAISLTYIRGNKTNIIAKSLKNDIENNLKIDVVLEPLDRNIYYEKINSQNYELALGSWIADFEDPINFLEMFKFKNDSIHNTGWENKKYVSLLDEFIARDIDERYKILKKAEDILLDELPIIPLYHLSQNYLKKTNLKDIKIYPSGFIDFKYAYFED